MGKKAKKNKNALPKRIAGVKIPKALRKSGDRALALAQTHLMSEVVASGLVAAAAALASSDAGKKAGRKAKRHLKALRKDGAGNANELAGAVAAAVGSAMQHWLGQRLGKAGSDKKAGGAAGLPTTQH